MNPPNKNITNNYKLLTTLLFLFFTWGFITLMNDLLLPIVKENFHLNYFEATLIDFCFFISYGIFSIPVALILQKISYKKTMVLGLLIIALGSLLMKIVYAFNNYPLFLFGLTVIALGVIFLQVSANPFISDLGHDSTAPARLTLAQGINSLGYIIAPLIFSHIALKENISTLYLIIVITLIAFSILLSFVNFNKTNLDLTTEDKATTNYLHNYKGILIFGIISIFFYVGAEVSAGSLIINFAMLPNISSNYTITTASSLLIFFWGGAMVGRLAGSYILKVLNAPIVLMVFSAINLLLLLAIILSNGNLSLYVLLSLGLFNSIMFPTIFALTIESMPKHIKSKASGYLITAIVGGAFIPVIQGNIADLIGLQSSFSALFPSYLIILFFAIYIFKSQQNAQK